MADQRLEHVTLRLARGYEFVAEFNDLAAAPAILLDEPAPFGDGRGPNASAVLGAAVGNCLAASLAFCLRKSRVDLQDLTAQVTTRIVRNDRGRSRIGAIEVELSPVVGAAGGSGLARCAALFEEFCTVTASVRQGIPVSVTVHAGNAAADPPVGA